MIPERYNGPPGSANGGYACGLVAGAIGHSARVRLLQPPPLGVPLIRRRCADGAVRLQDGGVTIAVGYVARPLVAVPHTPSLRAAADATVSFSGMDPELHPFPSCFVCGPERVADGLGLFPGHAGEDGLLACPWFPGFELSRGGVIDPRFVWAALDCPAGFACMPPGSHTVLASMTATLEAAVRPDRAYVVTAWPVGDEGRRHWAGSAIHDSEGVRVAVAESLWITLRGQDADPAGTQEAPARLGV